MQKKIIKNIISDISVEAMDEFDRNFERKAFFNKAWAKRRRDGRGSLMVVSGGLRRSLKANKSETKITFRSSVPYALIHNTGGRIRVTKQMRKFFWYQYYKNMKGVSFSIVTRGTSNKKSVVKNNEAEYWRNMALKKGSTIGIRKRQFIGDHPVLTKRIDKIIKNNITEYLKELKLFKPVNNHINTI